VTEFASPPLSAWGNFYVIVGSAGAALVAIQFVVITLIAAMRLRPTPDSISAFGTPTVVHLAGASPLRRNHHLLAHTSLGRHQRQ
jgi:hypothetical protein